MYLAILLLRDVRFVTKLFVLVVKTVTILLGIDVYPVLVLKVVVCFVQVNLIVFLKTLLSKLRIAILCIW